MITTTNLITLLKNIEKGTSGRSRVISFEIGNEKAYLDEPNVEISSTSDGVCGATVCLRIVPKDKK